MAAGDIGNSIEAYEYESTYARHPFIVQVKEGLFCIGFEGTSNEGEAVAFLIDESGNITTPEEDRQVIHAANTAFLHGAFYPIQNAAFAFQLAAGNVGIEGVKVSDLGAITQAGAHYCSAAITGATEFNLILQRSGILALITEHSAGEAYVITFGCADDGSIGSPRKSILSMEGVLSTYPQCIKVNDAVILGAYYRTNTDVYARPLGVAADGTLSGLAQATTQIANLQALPRDWCNPQTSWFILALQGPGTSVTLAVLSVAADGTFSIPANNTYTVDSLAGYNPMLTVLNQNTLCVTSFDGSYNGFLHTLAIAPGDPFVWTPLDSKQISTADFYSSNSILIAEDVLGISWFTTANDGEIETYEVTSEAVQLGHHELMMGSGP